MKYGRDLCQSPRCLTLPFPVPCLAVSRAPRPYRFDCLKLLCVLTQRPLTRAKLFSPIVYYCRSFVPTPVTVARPLLVVSRVLTLFEFPTTQL